MADIVLVDKMSSATVIVHYTVPGDFSVEENKAEKIDSLAIRIKKTLYG